LNSFVLKINKKSIILINYIINVFSVIYVFVEIIKIIFSSSHIAGDTKIKSLILLCKSTYYNYSHYYNILNSIYLFKKIYIICQFHHDVLNGLMPRMYTDFGKVSAYIILKLYDLNNSRLESYSTKLKVTENN